MNFNNQHSNDQHASDEIIERELKALREAPQSAYGVGGAIKTMRSTPKVSKRSLRWPIGLGSLAVAGGALVLVISVSTGKAYARELHEISSAQEKQKTMRMNAYLYGGKKTPYMMITTVLDHHKEAISQRDGSGQLEYVSIGDGSLRYTYAASGTASGLIPTANIEVDYSEHFRIESIEEYLQSDFFRKHKIEKTSGVTLNGKTCDLYNFANGYYRLWVDPATKLPLQREIYDKGVTLWERDTYEYPTEVPQQTFAEPKIPGVKFFYYPPARRELAEKLEKRGQTQKVGEVTIELRAVVRDKGTVAALWTTTGEPAPTGAYPIVEIEGTQPGTSFGLHTSGYSVIDRDKILTQCHRFEIDKPASSPLKVKIGAWKNKKLVGWATFLVDDVRSYPSIGQIFATPSPASGVAKAVSTK